MSFRVQRKHIQRSIDDNYYHFSFYIAIQMNTIPSESDSIPPPRGSLCLPGSSPPTTTTTTTVPQQQHLLLEASPSWESVSTFFLGRPPRFSSTTTVSTRKLIQEILEEPHIDQHMPDLHYTVSLLLALLLTTTLSCLSALDAKNQCASVDGYEAYSSSTSSSSGNHYYHYYDDLVESEEDESITFWELLQEKHNCLQMFRLVMIPVCSVTWVCGLLALMLIRRHHVSEADYCHTRMERRLLVHRLHLHQCLRLSVILTPVLLAWSFGIVAFMLSPRETTEGENPYRSLAAVDDMGHIGQNANLYYLSWISVGLSTALVYQIGVDTIRQYQLYRAERQAGAVSVGDVEAMLSSLTALQLETFRETRATWYQSMYRLRIRTGIWTSALLTVLVVMTSSWHIWRAVLIPAAKSNNPAGSSIRFRDVCQALQGMSEIPPEMCPRTAFSLFSGMMAAMLCMGAISMHVAARTGAAQVVDKQMSMNVRSASTSKFGGTHIPLRSELILAVILSNLLGMNAVLATGVQGPAATVGNLYYASWIGFLLCLRISLGCLEEMANLEHEEDDTQTNSALPDYVSAEEEERSGKSETSRLSGLVPESSTDLLENDRALRTRMYLSLAICSTACSASALDAAMNQSHTIVMTQNFVIYAPSTVAVICACQFLLCLRARSYMIVSQLWFGGVLSVVVFCICMASLVLNMHSESSWAVDGIGDIEIANLYYFTWASMIIAGMQMASYINIFFGKKSKDYVTVVWLAICKVCFVLLGAGYHVWHTISDTCNVDDIHLDKVTFCSKTIFAIGVALSGLFVAGMVAMGRISLAMFWPNFSTKLRAHVEMIVSFLLMMLFGMAVVLITGIGGPGQSVGDMYYSVWLCFFVTIGLAVTCLKQIQEVDGVVVERTQEDKATEMTSMYTPPPIHLPAPTKLGRPPLPSIS